MLETVIEARGVRKRFGRGRKAVDALKGVDMAFAAGKVTGLVGPNGAGKSTFIKAALGFLRPNGGEIRILGHEPGAEAALARLGYLPENPSFPQFLSGAEVLRYVAALQGIRGPRARTVVDDLLVEVGIAHAGKRRVWGYSKGMTQRLGLAQALVGDPELLILDEPMSGLDPIGRAHVKEMLRRRRDAGTSIVFCSHILDDVERLSENVIVLGHGRVQYSGTVAEVLVAETPQWSALIQAADLPSGLAGIDWQPAGSNLWSVVDLDEAGARAIKRAALDDEIQIVRLNQQTEDLEDLFIRLAAESEADDA